MACTTSRCASTRMARQAAAAVPRPARASLRVQAFKVTLKTPTGLKEITCDKTKTVLQAALDAGVNLPNLCVFGTCGTCIGKCEGGKLENSEQGFLTEDQVAEGLVLLCCAYPESDATILTHQESAALPFKKLSSYSDNIL